MHIYSDCIHSCMCLCLNPPRQRRESEVLREENKNYKMESGAHSKENDELRKETEKLEKRVQKLAGFEEECDSLQEANKTLTEEVENLRQNLESILIEKEDLEYQNQETMQALNEERAAKSVLETKLQEESFRSPAHPSWDIEEKENISPSVVDGNQSNHTLPTQQQQQQNLTVSSPTPSTSSNSTRLHSTPYSPRRTPSLLSELQSSLIANVDSSELETLRKRCKEAENLITTLQKEKLALEEKVTSFSLEKTEASTRIEQVKEEYAKGIVEKDKTVEALREDILVKEEMVGQLRNKLSTALAERASIEIEVDGLKDELQRVKQSTSAEIDKVQRECIQEQSKNLELKGQVIVLEEQIDLLSKTIVKLEKVIFNSHSELSSMTDDLQKLHKTVATLGSDGKYSSKNALKQTVPAETEYAVEEEEEESCYSLELTRYRTSIQIHGESHSLNAIVQLHEELKSVRTPLEQFTRTMLERSLANSAKGVPLSPTSPTGSVASSIKKNPDFEASVNKWKVKLAHKTEEVNNLRAIMKARSTTADVAITSLRSKLEGQARAYQAEMTRLKHQIKTLKKERDEHLSLRTMYAKRCEDYVDEITKMKRELEKCKMDYDDVMLSLKKTIQRKLELSTELEEYRMEQERVQLIPKLLGSSRI